MMMSNAFTLYSDAEIEGVFRVTQRFESDEPLHWVELSNSELTVRAELFESSHIQICQQGRMPLVYLAGEIVQQGETPIVEVTSLFEASDFVTYGLPPLYTLPSSLTPKASALKFIVTVASRIQNHHLRSFVQICLDRDDRIELFLNIPASISYHHSFQGGLLVHTAEVMRNIISMIKCSEPDMHRDFYEIAVVAALFHDIGKIRQYDVDGRPNEVLRLVGHDVLTLEVCAEGLHYLDGCDRDLATLLRHVLTCGSPGARYGTKPMHTIARYLRDADGQSANAHNYQLATARTSSLGFIKIGNQTFWQPQR